MKVYAEYCGNQDQAVETLNLCSKNSSYVAYEDVFSFI